MLYLLFNTRGSTFIETLRPTVISNQTSDDELPEPDAEERVEASIRLFRAPFLVIWFLFCICLNMYGWRYCGINYVYIFELDRRKHVTEHHLVKIATMFGGLFFISILIKVLRYMRNPLADIFLSNEPSPFSFQQHSRITFKYSRVNRYIKADGEGGERGAGPP